MPEITSAAQRTAVLDRRQRLKMAESAHAYVRGNTIRFYEWLKSKSVQSAVPSGPEIWICGDCHTGNLGPVADLSGKVEIQIRDLDQTVIGNPAHDLLRLGLSLAMAARSSDLPGVTTALMMEELVLGYIVGLGGRRGKREPENLEPIMSVVRAARARRWKHLAQERIEDVRPTIPLGNKFWALAASEHRELQELFEGGSLSPLVRCISGGPDDQDQKIKLMDAAYWMKGCSSLGNLRYAVLVRIGTKKKPSYRLLDFKEATAAVAPATKPTAMPKNFAERVVTGARALSPFLGDRMIATALGHRPIVVRELRPQDMKFDLTKIRQAEATAIARLMACVVGRAHGRQMSQDQRHAWAKELKQRHGKGLEAPRWIWSGVLDLAALHEGAYLEHCRQYALGRR